MQNDHKPLSSILPKPLHKSPPPIQRFYLRLMKYKFTFEHKPGQQMTVADALSRAVQSTTSKTTEIPNDDIATYIHPILDDLPVSEKKPLNSIMTILQHIYTQYSMTYPLVKRNSRRKCE